MERGTQSGPEREQLGVYSRWAKIHDRTLAHQTALLDMQTSNRFPRRRETLQHEHGAAVKQERSLMVACAYDIYQRVWGDRHGFDVGWARCGGREEGLLHDRQSLFQTISYDPSHTRQYSSTAVAQYPCLLLMG